ncbi:uracil-DNA glycosylase [Candidatus Bipolaricaulota bacterium]|nr:uracil-DNA glycosylase [Candidatus Bipolaricaulota bacterium]
MSLGRLRPRVEECTMCPLGHSRKHAVFGEGDPAAKVMFVGEGPGEAEDETGQPFVGPAGKKLDEVLASVGISRSDVFITNVVKCRPPNNRVPAKAEMQACFAFLEAQIALVNPSLIVTLGNVPTQWLLESVPGITQTRGRFYSWRGGIQIFPMFHPSYLLRNPSRAKGSPKYLAWQDVQQIRRWMDGSADVPAEAAAL